jgi:hypothetical protein
LVEEDDIQSELLVDSSLGEVCPHSHKVQNQEDNWGYKLEVSNEPCDGWNQKQNPNFASSHESENLGSVVAIEIDKANFRIEVMGIMSMWSVEGNNFHDVNSDDEYTNNGTSNFESSVSTSPEELDDAHDRVVQDWNSEGNDHSTLHLLSKSTQISVFHSHGEEWESGTESQQGEFKLGINNWIWIPDSNVASWVNSWEQFSLVESFTGFNEVRAQVRSGGNQTEEILSSGDHTSV